MRGKGVAKVTKWDFREQSLVEDFKVVFKVFKVKYFNDPFLSFSWLRRVYLLLGRALEGQGYLWYAFWYGIDGKHAFWDRTSGEEA